MMISWGGIDDGKGMAGRQVVSPFSPFSPFGPSARLTTQATMDNRFLICCQLFPLLALAALLSLLSLVSGLGLGPGVSGQRSGCQGVCVCVCTLCWGAVCLGVWVWLVWDVSLSRLSGCVSCQCVRPAGQRQKAEAKAKGGPVSQTPIDEARPGAAREVL